jgi:hypothetical protein
MLQLQQNVKYPTGTTANSRIDEGASKINDDSPYINRPMSLASPRPMRDCGQDVRQTCDRCVKSHGLSFPSDTHTHNNSGNPNSGHK